MTGRVAVAVVVSLLAVGCIASAPPEVVALSDRFGEAVALPAPTQEGADSLEELLSDRRSQRTFAPTQLGVKTLGQLFWAAQGVTDESGKRTAPSAGALYPLELYAVTPTAFMHYLPNGHRIEERRDATARARLSDAAFGQSFVSEAPIVLVIAGAQARTEAKYGAIAGDLMNREAGHAAQNILLQAVALDLVAVPIGGFDPHELAEIFALPPGEEVLYLIPLGMPGPGTARGRSGRTAGAPAGAALDTRGTSGGGA